MMFYECSPTEQEIESLPIFRSLGLNIIERRVTRRGGVYKLSNGMSSYALKSIIDRHYVPDSDLYKFSLSRAKSLMREANILERLQQHTSHAYIGHGVDMGITWLLTSWLEGRNLYEVANSVRASHISDIDKQERLLNVCYLCLQQYARLHKVGYLHGDIQGKHVIFLDEINLALLDFEFARAIGDNGIYYPGGFAHYVPPEVARQMLEKNLRVPYQITSEIYSLAALCYLVYTGYSYIDINELSSKREKLSMIANKNAPRFTLGALENTTDPFLLILKECLYFSQERRPKDLSEVCYRVSELIR